MSSFVAISDKSTSRCLDMESLQRRCLGRVDLANRVLEKFRVTVEDDMALLEQALSARNLQEVARVAHRVKGSSLSVSACNLAEFSHRLECQALTAATTAVPQCAENHAALDSLHTLEALWCELHSEYLSVSKLTAPIAEGPKS